MSLETFYSRAGHLVRRLNQIAVAIFLEETGGIGLTTVQWAALQMIREIPAIDQASLSSMIAFDKTTIVKVLDRLAEKGLITRTRSQTDRRSNLLHVTPRGRSALNKVEPLMDRIEQRILAPLSAGDQRKFLEMLTRLVHVNNAYSRAPLDREVWSDLLRKKGTQVQSPGKARRARRKEKRGGSG
jgi:DNA-binding MarR family transcriptional regulator